MVTHPTMQTHTLSSIKLPPTIHLPQHPQLHLTNHCHHLLQATPLSIPSTYLPYSPLPATSIPLITITCYSHHFPFSKHFLLHCYGASPSIPIRLILSPSLLPMSRSPCISKAIYFSLSTGVAKYFPYSKTSLSP